MSVTSHEMVGAKIAPHDPASALARAVAHVGGVSQMARALGVRQNRVSNWLSRGVPPAWVPRVSLATGGLVGCEEFDPVAFPPIREAP